MKPKEEFYTDWMDMVKQSWSWERLTEDEQKRFTIVVEHAKFYGNYKQRWEQANTIYHAFLIGTDYKPFGWRETEEVPKF